MTSGSTGAGLLPAVRRTVPPLMACRRPSPSGSPGILRSLTTISIGVARSRSSASPPLCARVTSWPARRRQIPRNSRIDCSSSTTRIFPTHALWHARRYHRSLRGFRVSHLVERSAPIALTALIVYVALASSEVVDGDNAEFATLGAVGGRAHPSGYPLYVLWLRAWSWLPGQTQAHSAAFATAILGAAAVL